MYLGKMDNNQRKSKMKIKQIVTKMMGENIYIVYDDEKECFIVDPGGEFKEIVQTIEKNQLNVKGILLTHSHYDHIEEAENLREKYSCTVYIGEGDEDMLENPKLVRASIDVRPVKVYKKVKENDIIKIGSMEVKVIEAKGHTKGGVCYLLDDVMFAGDNIFKGNIGRCDLYGGDFDLMKKTLKKLSKFDCRVMTGHGESTTMENERSFNPYFGEV